MFLGWVFHVVVCILLLVGSGSITSVGEERANLLVIMWFLLERFPLLLGAWDRLCYFIVALPEPSINLFNKT